MKMPNGYGTIINLGKNKRRPWALRVTTHITENGKQVKKYVGYYEKREEAVKAQLEFVNDPAAFNIVNLAELYEQWSKRYDKLSDKSVAMYKTAWNRLSKLSKMQIRDIKTYHIQNIIDNANELSRSAQKQIKSLASQLFDYAIQNDLATKNYAQYVELKKDDKKEKEIFTDLEIQKLWKNLNHEYVDSILIMIYTGMRVGELLSLTSFNIDTDEWVIRHGSKTDAGKNRVIPVSKKIQPLIEKLIGAGDGPLIKKDGRKVSVDYYRKFIYYPLLEKLKIRKLTPHSCRHTFATLLSKNVSDKVLIQKLLGHTDYSITANIYTHKDINDLSEAISSI